MSLIAEFEVTSPHTALAAALDTVPDVELEVIQQVGTEPDRPDVSVWADAASRERWEAAMSADETVGGIDRYTVLDDLALYRMRVTEATEVVGYPMRVRLGADQLSARWRDGRWRCQFRFPDRAVLSECREWCDENGVRFDLNRLYGDTGPVRRTTVPRLTDEQREVLAVASDLGYFQIPREAWMADLATELGISSQAVSERLRRGHQRLVEDYLT